ncbi:DNA repair protein RecO [Clostridium felsineum]|uniref:DNA repair protein RecO n=2 Tax=Clostridium felsineum TaxID=36839 RepID=A0A1S8LAT0_9CLOT|nr:DNA repair protein RecO [Clostridium felsineum]URZ06103.1 DNA repair protein RecO [Clostridium felsineum]URZ11140.1 DNA repair protein RecO [Clostridium felsineum]URZ15768.1 DNA repair protein RecO [Clostridium felsineum DSM 794]
MGKISVIAKGAKKNRSKYLPISINFCFGNFVFFKGKSMFSLNEGEIIDSFQEFLSDLDTLTYTSYLCELIDISMAEGESNRDLFKEFVSTFYLIKNKVGDMETLIRAFELKLLKYTGYDLNFDYCSKCKKRIKKASYISYRYYGGICDDCSKEGGVAVNPAVYSSLNYLNKLPIEKVYRVTLNNDIKDEVFQVLKGFIGQNYAKLPKSLDLLNIIKRSE